MYPANSTNTPLPPQEGDSRGNDDTEERERDECDEVTVRAEARDVENIVVEADVAAMIAAEDQDQDQVTPMIPSVNDEIQEDTDGMTHENAAMCDEAETSEVVNSGETADTHLNTTEGIDRPSDSEEDAPLVTRVKARRGNKNAIESDEDMEVISPTAQTEGREKRQAKRTGRRRSEEEEEPIPISMGTRSARKRVKKVEYEEDSDEEVEEEEIRKQKKANRKDKKQEEDTEEETKRQDDIKGVADPKLESMSTSMVGHTALEKVTEMECKRTKCKSLQGAISGMFKRNLEYVKQALGVMITRIEDSGDVRYLRMVNNEQTAMISDLKKENARLCEQLASCQPIGRDSPPRKRKIMEREVRSPPIATATEDFPPLPQRPALRGVNHPIPVPGSKQLQGADRENEIIRQIRTLQAQRKDITQRKDTQEREGQKGWSRRGTGTGWDREEAHGSPPHGIRCLRPTTKPRIIANVQTARPMTTNTRKEVPTNTLVESDTEWALAKSGRWKRRERKKQLQSNEPEKATAPRKDTPRQVNGTIPDNKPAAPKRRPPTTTRYAAVTITAKNENFSYAEALREVRDKVSLKELGIDDNTRMRRAINGGILIEVPGTDAQDKAKKLAESIQRIVADNAVVASPVKQGEVKITGIDQSVSLDELTGVLSNAGGCLPLDIKAGPIKMMKNGFGIAWVKMPLAAAIKVTNEGKLRLGWTMARTELLKTRPLQCFRCWHFGHVQHACKSPLNRVGACFNCGEQGHRADTCRARTQCRVCRDGGLPDEHRLAGPLCQTKITYETSLIRRPGTTPTNNDQLPPN